MFYRRKCARLAARVREVEASLAVAAEKVAAERRGRVRAQQVRSPPSGASSFLVLRCAFLFEMGHIIRLVLSNLYFVSLLAVAEEGTESAGVSLRRGEAGQGRLPSILPAGANWHCPVLLLH